ncbi:hypothetical protein [Sphingomonas sp. RS2018]
MTIATGAILFGPRANANEAPPPVWAGVWQGTVGSLPIRACLTRRYDGAGAGLYFYDSRLQLIGLEQQGGSKAWREGADGAKAPRPAWQFATVARNALTGTWTDGRRQLPFRLTRLASEIDEPCGSLAFNAPRLKPLTVTRTRATLDGVGYTRIVFDAGRALRDDVALETFALDGADRKTARINARLFAPFAEKPADSMWWGCIAGGLASPGMGGNYDQSITPTLISPRWLAATLSTSYYCGGAHPDGETTSLVFDRSTGAEVDLNGWLSAAAVEPRPDIGTSAFALKPALRRLAMAQDRQMEAECRDPVAEAEFWDIGLTRTGLAFTPGMPHVLAPCANAMIVPWAALAPYLSQAGRAGWASLNAAYPLR